MSDGEDASVSAEVPAAPPPPVETPAVEAPSAPATETTIPVPEPTPEIEIEAAPAAPETPAPPASEPAEPEIPEAPEPALEPTKPTPPPQSASEPAPEKAAVSSAATTNTVTISDTSIRSRLGQALEALKFRKRAKLDKILVLAAKRREIGLGPNRKAGLNAGEGGGVAEISSRKLSVTIKNDDVEKLLRVSDSTAQRYLNQLVAEGKLRRVGHPKQPTYEPV